ncbi:MAG TPA: NUDIX domain-containing protein [Streptosporangiaceae bacterium]|nr:NUDIX domain-containing protein [Streptosporangiaceae bacterium]
MPADGGEGRIHAAGAVLWRPGADGPQVALVHRRRYDDWSLPKGKLQPGEHVLLTAVREVAEETGIRVVLGRRLPSTHYERDGRPKMVDYWAAKAADEPQPGFTPNGEVDQVDWLDLPAARRRLSYAHDTGVLDEFGAGPADTTPLILVRHASAGSKGDWRAAGHHDDLARPLDTDGTRQAEMLAHLLLCYPKGTVLSSAAERCVASVRPYADAAGLAVHIDQVLTVGLASSDDVRRRTDEVLGSGLPAVICGHRENLPVLLEETCAVLGGKRPEDPSLPFAGFWVLHIGWDTLASAERHQLVPG